MSMFKGLLIGGIAAGVLAGGTIALFTSGKKPAPAKPDATAAESPAAALAPAPAAPTGTPADQAAALNEKGKNLMFAGKFAESTPLFRQAVTLVPEPKYFFNLGLSLFQEGKFDEALAALDGVRRSNPTPEHLEKTKRMRAKVLDECKGQNIECHDPWPAVDGSSTPAGGPTSQAIIAGDAEGLNERGKTEMFAGRFDEAARLFWRAFELESQPKYGFNLATALFQSLQFDEALDVLTELRAVPMEAPMRAKTDSLFGKVWDECQLPPTACDAKKASKRARKAISASKLNDEGTGLMLAKKFAAAESKFRDALVLVMSARYAFNLASALFQQGRFDEALAAVDGMQRFGATAAQLEEGQKLQGKILGQCRGSQSVDCHDAALRAAGR